jgi:hypothetical protein
VRHHPASPSGPLARRASATLHKRRRVCGEILLAQRRLICRTISPALCAVTVGRRPSAQQAPLWKLMKRPRLAFPSALGRCPSVLVTCARPGDLCQHGRERALRGPRRSRGDVRCRRQFHRGGRPHARGRLWQHRHNSAASRHLDLGDRPTDPACALLRIASDSAPTPGKVGWCGSAPARWRRPDRSGAGPVR